jgi:sugar O-acyltransferase (sialic acid O-acetyltransferase NeuD family)
MASQMDSSGPISRAQAVVIVGVGGQAKSVLEACRAGGVPLAGFLVPLARTGILAGVPMLGTEERLGDQSFVTAFRFVAATGDRAARRRIATSVWAAQGRLATVTHPSCVVAGTAVIEEGAMLMAGAIIGPDARVGRFCIVNTAASVDHDDVLEDGVNICPGAHLAGNVTCREDVFVGIGAAVIQGVTIGRRAIVGAGAVVIRDVADDTTVVGCPARERPRPPGQTDR